MHTQVSWTCEFLITGSFLPSHLKKTYPGEEPGTEEGEIKDPHPTRL